MLLLGPAHDILHTGKAVQSNTLSINFDCSFINAIRLQEASDVKTPGGWKGILEGFKGHVVNGNVPVRTVLHLDSRSQVP